MAKKRVPVDITISTGKRRGKSITQEEIILWVHRIAGHSARNPFSALGGNRLL
jgi:hypothetical protein